MSKLTKKEVIKIARKKGIKIEIPECSDRIEKSKEQLIREIQRVEGNIACYNTSVHKCSYINCCWYNECQK